MAGHTSPFGDLLRKLRQGAGLTMEGLAEASGVSVRAISDMERGHSRAPQARTLAALAEGLGVGGEVRAGLEAEARRARSTRGAGRPRLGEPPRSVTDFVGRVDELVTVRRVVSDAAKGDTPPVVVVHGQPGLGKTAFALRVAAELRGDFPDGCLYIDLRGVDLAALSVEDASMRLLRALGLRSDQVVDGGDERSAQVRALLQERCCMVVLDNAGSEAQVRPLLPSGGGSCVLVTSRRALSGLDGVVRIALPPLAPDEAAQLLGSIAVQASGPDVASHVETVAGLCGHLPLAVRIAATRLASRPQWTVENLVDRLGDAGRRLATLSAGDTGVATAFALSYAQLPAPIAALFRRLAHVSSADFAAPIAAVLAETTLSEVEDRLDELVEVGLLQPDGVDRYRLHDLLRLYAVEQLETEETADARAETARRMSTWLLETVIVAGRWYEPDYGTLPDNWSGLMPLTTLEDAGAWLRAEIDSWLPAMRAAAADGRHQLVVDAAAATYWFSVSTMRWRGWYEVRTLARAAAAALPDRRQQARHTSHFAWTAVAVGGRYSEGAEAAMEAYGLAQEIGDLREQARALNAAGYAFQDLDRFDDTLWAHRTGCELAARAGDHDQYVDHVLGIGFALEHLGHYDEAIVQFRRALAELDRLPVSPRPALTARASALFGAASSLDRAGRYAESLPALDQAIPVLTEHGDDDMMPWALALRGKAYAELGRATEARVDLTHALDLLADSLPSPFEDEARAILARLPDEQPA